MTSYGCVNYVGDEDCRKCMIHGILLTGCPWNCKDYEDMYGNTGVLRDGLFKEGR